MEVSLLRHTGLQCTPLETAALHITLISTCTPYLEIAKFFILGHPVVPPTASIVTHCHWRERLRELGLSHSSVNLRQAQEGNFGPDLYIVLNWIHNFTYSSIRCISFKNYVQKISIQWKRCTK